MRGRHSYTTGLDIRHVLHGCCRLVPVTTVRSDMTESLWPGTLQVTSESHRTFSGLKA
jgi:hypothetical protein